MAAIPNQGIPNQNSFQEDLNMNLGNKDPAFISSTLGLVVAYIQGYGWFIVAFIVFAMYAISKLKPKIDQLKQSAVDGVFKKTDSNAASQRAEAMARAREKMQEQLNRQAEVAKQKQAEKDEQKRLEKIENHDLAKQGKSKLKPKDDAPDSSSLKPGSKPKKSLKSDYSPLMGGGGSCAYRPARKTPSAGG